jgi:serine/threonine protein kinase
MLGEGGMGMVYLAQRRSSDGTSMAAFKIVRPDVVALGGNEAELSIRKEAVALGRLNEQVPPTPHVVRLLDAGSVAATFNKLHINLPWLALEYVSGGADGTTLHERVNYLRKTQGHALPPLRAAHVIEHVGAGLEAVHREGVIHRDLKPGNVLCAGFGSSEVFKISDFGIARPRGLDGTFGNVFMGTPGYVAPEQSFPDHGEVGPWTDVFSFAALCFFVLTGESYFSAKNLAHALMLATNPERRRLTDCAGLSRELSDLRATCEELDRLLAAGTASDIKARPPSAQMLAQAVVSVLHRGSAANAKLHSLPPSTAAPRASSQLREWNVVHAGAAGRSVRRAGWDGQGHCLAITSNGLEYWSGTAWSPLQGALMFPTARLGVVTPIKAGAWILAGSEGRAFLYRAGDQAEPLPPWQPAYAFTAAAGDPEDLAVFVAHSPAGSPQLVGMTGRRWMRPLALPGVAAISDLVRIADTRWLVCGSQDDGRGFACTFDPLMLEHAPLLTTPGALVACAGQAREQAIVLGLGGSAIRVTDGHLAGQRMAQPTDFWSAAIDSAGVAWGGAWGSLWLQPAPGEPWIQSFDASGWSSPFTSLFADVGRVVAMTRSGAVVEGRR